MSNVSGGSEKFKEILEQIKSNKKSNISSSLITETNIVKKNLPDIEKITSDNYSIHKSFIQAATKHYYNHTYSYHNEPTSYEVINFFNWLQSDSLYIVRSGNRALGYFVLHTNSTVDNEHISYSIFVHPNVCKLNSVILSLSAYVSACLLAQTISSFSISTYYNHSLLFSDISKIYNSKFLKLQTNLYYFTTDLTTYSGKIESTLQKYYDSSDIVNYKNIIF